MAEENSTDPFITVQFSHGQENLTFSTPELFLEWIQKEKQFWEWAEFAKPAVSLYNTSKSNWQKLHNELDSYISSPQAQHLQRIRQQAGQLGRSGVQLVSEDPRAQFAKLVAETDPVEAGNVLLQFVRDLPADPRNTRAAVRASLFELGVSKATASAETRSLAKARQNWSDFTKEATGLSNDLKGIIRDFDTLAQNVLTDKSTGFDTAIDKFTRAADEHLEHGKSELEQIRKTYDERLAVQSSVDYWTQRATAHRTALLWNSGFAIIYVLLVVLVLCLTVGQFSLEVVTEFVNSDVMKTYWPVTVTIGFGLLIIWPLRIAARLYLSNSHLAIAAEERVTMIKTFLALLRTDKAVEQEDRRIILESLFRHLATGIVKDDGAPSSPVIDGFNKITSK